MNQRTIDAEYNDRSKPYHVEAGKMEMDNDQNVEKNFKYIDSFATLEEALDAVGTCQGYDFVDLLYADKNGYLWQVELDAANID